MLFRSGTVPKDRQRPMLKLLNDLNANYAWVRFFLDSDSEVAAAADAVITTASAPRVCWEMLRRVFSVLDEVQEKIDKVLK